MVEPTSFVKGRPFVSCPRSFHVRSFCARACSSVEAGAEVDEGVRRSITVRVGHPSHLHFSLLVWLVKEFHYQSAWDGLAGERMLPRRGGGAGGARSGGHAGGVLVAFAGYIIGEERGRAGGKRKKE